MLMSTLAAEVFTPLLFIAGPIVIGLVLLTIIAVTSRRHTHPTTGTLDGVNMNYRRLEQRLEALEGRLTALETPGTSVEGEAKAEPATREGNER